MTSLFYCRLYFSICIFMRKRDKKNFFGLIASIPQINLVSVQECTEGDRETDDCKRRFLVSTKQRH